MLIVMSQTISSQEIEEDRYPLLVSLMTGFLIPIIQNKSINFSIDNGYIGNYR